MYLSCDNRYCKYHDSEVNKCIKNNYYCPYQKELREKENKTNVSETVIKPLFDAINLEKSEAKPIKNAIIKQPKVIARVSIFGEGLVFNIMDTCKGFIKPTKKQIKNLKKYFGIDIKLFDNDKEAE